MIERIRSATWKRRMTWLVAAAVISFALIQVVPYGRSHANPPASDQVDFPDRESRQIFTSACADCHSDLTEWPWYSNIAPMSWLVQNHVDEGRSKFNVSEWGKPQPPLPEVIDQIRSGEMPPWNYSLIHRDANLSGSQEQRLINALKEIYSKQPPSTLARESGD